MKIIHITTCIAAALLSVGTASAQGTQGQRGAGYGGPPKTEAERAARQKECQQSNGGNCDLQGEGKVRGQRRGPRDGSGSRGGNGPRGGRSNCPTGT